MTPSEQPATYCTLNQLATVHTGLQRRRRLLIYVERSFASTEEAKKSVVPKSQLSRCAYEGPLNMD